MKCLELSDFRPEVGLLLEEQLRLIRHLNFNRYKGIAFSHTCKLYHSHMYPQCKHYKMSLNVMTSEEEELVVWFMNREVSELNCEYTLIPNSLGVICMKR